jgi:hypothetical protein
MIDYSNSSQIVGAAWKKLLELRQRYSTRYTVRIAIGGAENEVKVRQITKDYFNRFVSQHAEQLHKRHQLTPESLVTRVSIALENQLSVYDF